MRKVKSIEMPDFDLPLERAPQHRADIYDAYIGGKAPSGTAGIVFEGGSVAVQTYVADNYRLAQNLGGTWYELCQVRRDDPKMLKLDKAGLILRAKQSETRESKHERSLREAEERAEASYLERIRRAIERAELRREKEARDRKAWIEMHR